MWSKSRSDLDWKPSKDVKLRLRTSRRDERVWPMDTRRIAAALFVVLALLATACAKQPTAAAPKRNELAPPVGNARTASGRVEISINRTGLYVWTSPAMAGQVASAIRTISTGWSITGGEVRFAERPVTSAKETPQGAVTQLRFVVRNYTGHPVLIIQRSDVCQDRCDPNE